MVPATRGLPQSPGWIGGILSPLSVLRWLCILGVMLFALLYLKMLFVAARAF